MSLGLGQDTNANTGGLGIIAKRDLGTTALIPTLD